MLGGAKFFIDASPINTTPAVSTSDVVDIQSTTDQMSITAFDSTVTVDLHTTVNIFDSPTTATNLTIDSNNATSYEHVAEPYDLHITALTTGTNLKIDVDNPTSSEHITDPLDQQIMDLLDLHTADSLILHSDTRPTSYNISVTNDQIMVPHQPLQDTYGNIS